MHMHRRPHNLDSFQIPEQIINEEINQGNIKPITDLLYRGNARGFMCTIDYITKCGVGYSAFSLKLVYGNTLLAAKYYNPLPDGNLYRHGLHLGFSIRYICN